MTTTAHEDQFTPATQTIQRVREPYDTVSILKRNVADLELALKRQTERATHPGATHCDSCGLTWLDDGLNPLWCPYCKDAVPAPAVPDSDTVRNARRYLALRKVGVQVPGYDFVKFDWSLDAAADRLMEGGNER